MLRWLRLMMNSFGIPSESGNRMRATSSPVMQAAAPSISAAAPAACDAAGLGTRNAGDHLRGGSLQLRHVHTGLRGLGHRLVYGRVHEPARKPGLRARGVQDDADAEALVDLASVARRSITPQVGRGHGNSPFGGVRLARAARAAAVPASSTMRSSATTTP